MTLRRRAAYAVLGKRASHLHRLWRAARARSPVEPNLPLRAARAYIRRFGPTVRRGPFAGMTFPLETVGATLLAPKLIGSFEQELHEVIEEIVRLDPPTIVNIGCAEGYYAVGVARRVPAAAVVAFDPDPLAQRLCSSLAAANGVEDRVTLLGEAHAEDLRNVRSLSRGVVICDCEGCELAVLDPAAAPGLASAHVLVELHDFIVPVKETLLNRFRDTHTIAVIDAQEREPGAYEELLDWSSEDAEAALFEGRPTRMQWAWMRPMLPSSGT